MLLSRIIRGIEWNVAVHSSIPVMCHSLLTSISVRNLRLMRFDVTFLFPRRQLPRKFGVFTGVNKQSASVQHVDWSSEIATPVTKYSSPSRVQPHSFKRELVDI
jgi:hypothetical protein